MSLHNLSQCWIYLLDLGINFVLGCEQGQISWSCYVLSSHIAVCYPDSRVVGKGTLSSDENYVIFLTL